MNLNLAIKSTVAAAVLTAAGYASAVTPSTPLSFAEPNSVAISTASFVNTFSFHVDALSKFSAYANSSSQNIAGLIQVEPLSFSAISLGGVTGIISNSLSGSKASISTMLSAGNYTLTIVGSALPLVSSLPGVTGNYGTYSVYGSLAPVPEPASYAMFLAGLGIIGAVARRRQQNKI